MKRLLIANRGEIAMRIIRACREEGISPVAVYSEADRNSPHVLAADHAVLLGPPAAAESYLRIDKLIDAAMASSADAVHPGYGFLAERAPFAQAVVDAGLTFVGPSPHAIRAMGEKTSARRMMQDAGVPVVPGTVHPVRDHENARAVAREIGYPVLLKAVAGGGGKGMRVVEQEKQLESSFSQATSEALKAFGSGDVYIEKFVVGPRHVEIQVLADGHGNVVHFGERECSVQRRHQKLIEEAPSPIMTEDLRAAMGEAAVRAARAVEYVGAGTVEFLVDSHLAFYFLEMNTRIQVEHPVTELVYGVDLVREQLRIASGGAIARRGDWAPRGHAIECRITSEDPFNDFLPNTGKVTGLSVPSGIGIRWDGGIDVGSEVGLYYDSLLGKLIAWGESREVALSRMQRGLAELVVSGVPTCQSFHARVLDEPTFRSGDYNVGYFDSIGAELVRNNVRRETAIPMAVAVALLEHERLHTPVSGGQSDSHDGHASLWLREARVRGLR